MLIYQSFLSVLPVYMRVILGIGEIKMVLKCVPYIHRDDLNLDSIIQK